MCSLTVTKASLRTIELQADPPALVAKKYLCHILFSMELLCLQAGALAKAKFWPKIFSAVLICSEHPV